MMQKSILSWAILSLIGYQAFAQSLAVNTTGAAANPSSMVDITSTTKGLLIPRMTSAQRTAIGTPAEGLQVYQTDAPVGLYLYRSGTWSIMSTGTGWSITGNAGTLPATNFMGSTDNVDVAFRTFNTETFRMTNAQKLLIGVATPTAPATQKMEVFNASGDAIYGRSPNIGGWLGYETNFSFGTPAQNLLGAGVYATNNAAGYTSSFFSSSGSATVAANINYSNIWIANYNLVNNASATFNPTSSYNQLIVSNSTLGGGHTAVRGYSDRGTTAGNPGYTVGVEGLSNTQFQDAIGVEGLAFSNAGVSIGGYFEGSNYAGASFAYAYVGGTINAATARKIVGTGSVSEIIPTAKHGRVTLTAPESPEYWYQDYGSVKMINGKARVNLDPILADVVFIDEKNPIRVFCTPVDMLYFNGVTIVNQTPTGFDLVELNGGTHSGKLDYQLILKPKTNYGEGRFPQAPGPSYLKTEKEPAAAKAKNNPADGRKIFRWPAETETYNYKPEDMVGVGEEVRGGPHHGMIKMADGSFKPANPVDKRSITNEKNK